MNCTFFSCPNFVDITRNIYLNIGTISNKYDQHQRFIQKRAVAGAHCTNHLSISDHDDTQ